MSSTLLKLDRDIGLFQATGTNILSMVGVGPFLTIPVMLSAMGGPHILYAWLLGALIALCDGLVYAQLGAALPGSGGPYVYLREAYKSFGFGKLLSFVFIFQIILTAPLSIAGGAVGFADYLGFYWQDMPPWQHHGIAASVCIAMTALVYRPIKSIGRISMIMLAVVMLTLGWVIVAGGIKADWHAAFDWPASAFRFDGDFFAKIGTVSLLAMYNYGGYNTICNIGEEVKEPHKTIPRAIVLSIVIVVTLYVLISSSMLGLVPFDELVHTKTVASVFIRHAFSNAQTGELAARIMTALILFVTATSLYALILGYSRIPFAAARDGQFFKVFGKLHEKHHFPHVSLLVIGAVSLPFCFFSLGKLVAWLMQIQILVQFIWQCAGVMLLHRYRKDIPQPFTMWLYPIPALFALSMWSYVFVTSPLEGILFAVGFFVVAVFAYGLFRKLPHAEP
ncbi:MAG: amino acid permease [Myxococcales bacterium]|nr:MAG: amino acid permease [Myxococcales bacterium]